MCYYYYTLMCYDLQGNTDVTHAENLDSENTQSKIVRGFKKRKGEKLRKGNKKDRVEDSNNKGCNERKLEGDKDLSKNKNRCSPSPNTSSALSNLMGMVQGQNSKEHSIPISPKCETFNNNHCDQLFETERPMKELVDSFKDSRADENGKEKHPASKRCSNTKQGENTGEEVNDIRIWSEFQKDSSKDFHEISNYHNITRKRSYPSVDKSKEPNTTESKFFRFSALAKELSGR